MSHLPKIQYLNLGLIDYKKAWELQQSLHLQRRNDEIEDHIIFCEHLPVITVGRRQKARENIFSTDLPIYEVERGGDVTYHGPGQLVCYPILKLKNPDPHHYLRTLEEVVIQLCRVCHVETSRKQSYTGVWTQDGMRKIASIGVALRQGVTFHGFALNATIDVSEFNVINPCGLPADVMTSLVREKGFLAEQTLSVEALIPRCIEIFGREIT